MAIWNILNIKKLYSNGKVSWILKVIRRITKEMFKSEEDHCRLLFIIIPSTLVVLDLLVHLLTELDYSNNFKATRQWGRKQQGSVSWELTLALFIVPRSGLKAFGWKVRHPDNDVVLNPGSVEMPGAPQAWIHWESKRKKYTIYEGVENKTFHVG